MARLLDKLDSTERYFLANLDTEVEPLDVMHIRGDDSPLPERWRNRGQPASIRLFDAPLPQQAVPRTLDAPTTNGHVLETGMQLVLPVTRKTIRIEGIAGVGRRARVYKVVDDAGHLYALKVVRAHTPRNLASIARESVKAEVLSAYGIPCSVIIEAGEDYALKQWVDGFTGTDWLARAAREQHHVSSVDVAKLFAFFRQGAEQRVAIGDLRPVNMVISAAGEWVPVDPGAIVVGQTPEQVWRRYRRVFVRNWLGVKPYSPKYWLALILAPFAARHYAARD